MKTLALLCTFVYVYGFSNAQTTDQPAKINWISFEKAEELNAKEPRKILVDAFTHWCGPCRMMDQQTFKDPKVVEYVNKNFYAIKFDAEGPETINFNGKTYSNPKRNNNLTRRQRNAMHQLAIFLQVRLYPTIVILNEDLTKEGNYPGLKRPPEFIQMLEKIVNKGS